MAGTTANQQTIEELRDRFDSLNTRKIRLQAQQENADTRLRELKAQALEQFGTDDLKELKSKLAGIKKKNEKQRADYQKRLDDIEHKLLTIDEEFDEAAETND